MRKAPILASLFGLCIACAPTDLSALAAASETCRAITVEDYPAKKVRIATHTDFTRSHYPARIAEFIQNPLGCGEIVMLGDSLTERHDWAGSLNVPHIIRNRGISGDTSDGVLVRLKEIIASRPNAVFVLIGTNDLWSNNTAKTTAMNVEKIILTLRANNPQLPIFLQTVFPLRSDPARNEKVQSINVRLVDLARTNSVTIVDTYSLMVDERGLLKSLYTDDGVHLTPAGYKAWVSLLNDKVREAQSIGSSAKVP